MTDGETLIAFFGSRGVFAYDLDGELLWKKSFPPMRMRNAFGEGTAPVLHGRTLLLTFDHEGEDFLLALDKSTGEQLWRANRDQPSNWAAPLVVEHAGVTQAIVAAPSTVVSYEMASGKVLWQCAGLGLNTIPTPVYDGKRVFVMSGFRDPNLLAIDMDKAKGDISETDAVLWTNQRGNSYTPSPVLQDGILYMLSDNGLLSALRDGDGRAVLLATAAAQAVPLQVVVGGGRRQAVHGLRGRGCGDRQDGAEVRGGGDEHDRGRILHRHAGDR